ncbi:hypothetical protein D3C86_622630 [compost metagenome]
MKVPRRFNGNAYALSLAAFTQPQIITALQAKLAAVCQRSAVRIQIPRCLDRNGAIAHGRTRQIRVLTGVQRHVLGRLQLRGPARTQAQPRAQ